VRKLPLEQIREYEGKYTGELSEGESIKLKIIRLDDIKNHAPDMKALSAYYLYKDFIQ
jgi:hypothetical protein